ncbi:MAG: phenylalanine--tRNA ligase subunit beta [Syntrophomonas sp.]
MGVSLKWLKEYVDFDWKPEELAHNLTMAGVAIEGIEETDNDTVMELDLTPNRGDCLGLINLAREVAALNGTDVRIPELKITENGERIDDFISVKIDAPDLCPRYTARAIKNVTLKPSPAWMQEHLINSGIRPINNVVDITNYVMLETNQPLHAFDYSLLGQDHTIVVRRAKPGEKFTTLDDVERELDQNMLVITDGSKPVALAGVMGGLNTEINDSTTTVLLESACFMGTNIRRTSHTLALRSDSSIRFEKGTDINGVIYAVNRAANLIQELAGGEVVSGICDEYPAHQVPKKILLRPERVNYLLGTSIPTEEIKVFLTRLKFNVSDIKDYLMVEVPTYRPDIEMEVDLIEEVARLYGYQNIPTNLPYGPTTTGGLTPYQKFRDMVKSLAAHQLYEVINYSFINPTWLDMLLLPENSELRNVIKVANPLSEDQSVMRTLLLPGLLTTVSRNLARKNDNLAMFEMGSVFYPDVQGLPREKLKLAAVVAGNTDVNWLKHKVDMDFYYLKGIVESFLNQLGVTGFRFIEATNPGYHPGRTALIQVGEKILGVIGEIHPLVLQNFSIKPRACAFELDMEMLYEFSSRKIMMEEIARYPSVERDIAIIVDQALEVDRVISVIKEAEDKLLREVVVFDIYSGEQVPQGSKSIAFKLTLQASDRTLTDDEVSKTITDVLEALKTRLDARLR